jgi:TPR repeat protein
MHARVVLALILSIPLFAQDGPPPGKPPLRERAAKGDADAQFTLAKNYEAGRGGLKKDYAEAFKWYRAAAEQNDPFAQASLGLLYRFGKGVPKDSIQSYMWFQLAVDRLGGADRDSIVELRDALAAHMTPEQIAQATQLSREWKPSSSAK